jgi:hypothetical protein
MCQCQLCTSNEDRGCSNFPRALPPSPPPGYISHMACSHGICNLLLSCSHTGLHQVRKASMSVSCCLSACVTQHPPTHTYIHMSATDASSAPGCPALTYTPKKVHVCGRVAACALAQQSLLILTRRRERALTTIAELKATCIALYWQASAHSTCTSVQHSLVRLHTVQQRG